MINTFFYFVKLFKKFIYKNFLKIQNLNIILFYDIFKIALKNIKIIITKIYS